MDAFIKVSSIGNLKGFLLERLTFWLVGKVTAVHVP